KVSVVTSIFPLYDFTVQVGGDLVDVKLMLPPGVEAHGFSPTPNNMIAVKRADLFLYTSDVLEPWAGTIVAAVGVRDGKVVEVGKEIISATTDHTDHNKRHRGLDPHIWLDPALAVEMVEVIGTALSEVDQGNSAVYEDNSVEFISKLHRFDKQTKQTLQNCRLRTIVSGGHFAFGAFAKRYGLIAVSPFQGFSPDAQPSPKAIAELVRIVRKTGSKVIFHEELIQPKVAKIIADETGGRLLLLHGVHNVSRKELERGENYLSLMQKNVDNLKQGLQCQ
ncbi:MAG: zinc ABC transporter substrate-binding protein, partial [Desulfobulbaceae bacterium]|nr:zinc ABC transporter substrate-binding protein [Desulfobulbaceae bacterium]